MTGNDQTRGDAEPLAEVAARRAREASGLELPPWLVALRKAVTTVATHYRDDIGPPEAKVEDFAPEAFAALEAAEREIMTGSPLGEADTIRKLRIERGDVLVIQTPHRLSHDQAAHFEAWLKARLGPAVTVLILDQGTELKCLALGDQLALETVPLTGPDGRTLGWIARDVAADVLTGRKPLSFSIEGLGAGQTIQTEEGQGETPPPGGGL
jgi:hypothetical protein